MNNVFLVHVHYTLASSLVVAPLCEKFVGKMVITIACLNFDKSELLCCKIIIF